MHARFTSVHTMSTDHNSTTCPFILNNDVFIPIKPSHPTLTPQPNPYQLPQNQGGWLDGVAAADHTHCFGAWLRHPLVDEPALPDPEGQLGPVPSMG